MHSRGKERCIFLGKSGAFSQESAVYSLRKERCIFLGKRRHCTRVMNLVSTDCLPGWAKTTQRPRQRNTNDTVSRSEVRFAKNLNL